MSQFNRVKEATFKEKNIPSMENYNIFTPGATGSLKYLPADEMFKTWVINLKNASHIWRVKQVVHRALLETYHIQLSIDTTKVWCRV
jgi:hypothetical protein